ncbi:uncharacterized protein TRIVIDRAFT_214142 [Trichoderma virens Gv29-8]|uniref:Uncharacterized protein n=1 Tax=Hypocrea virens (strain Gv29-8 / FGSC 10586) TaxID=413071 RepID=G9N7C4_HYPVG|nr:uncharacterized protein TRIVIDRAFT_214142 [Trichoderma virens Gv29-8]EHK17621.1 hypothetical protein TRIVIDRAFT_214142 [Trichoderma virens Gv29-8]
MRKRGLQKGESGEQKRKGAAAYWSPLYGFDDTTCCADLLRFCCVSRVASSLSVVRKRNQNPRPLQWE